MRLIDADELIANHTEIVSKHKLYENGMTLAWGDEVVSVKNIKDAPTVNHWIPCSERLPVANAYHEYLITTLPFNNVKIVTLNRTLGGHFYWETVDFYSYELNEVSAWMPLPEPYRGDDK